MKVIMAVIAVIVSIGLTVVGIIGFVNWNNNRNHTLGRGDAPVAGVNRDARKIYEMPDRFSSVAMFCDEYGNSIYVTTKSDESRAMHTLKDGCE